MKSQGFGYTLRGKSVSAICARAGRVVLSGVLAAYLLMPSSLSFASSEEDGASALVEQATDEDFDASGEDMTGQAESGVAGDVDDSASIEEPSTADAIDLAVLWQDGSARIESAGEYVLTADVVVREPLVVALPEGSTATIDFAGFKATVEVDVNFESDHGPSAIDLSENAGSVIFTDSAYETEEKRPASSITLKATDVEVGSSVVYAVRDAATLDARPSATFEHIRIAAELEVGTPASCAASVTGVQTGVKSGEDEHSSENVDEPEERITFDSCTFDLKASANERSEELGLAIEQDAIRGSLSAIDAACSGVVLAGVTECSFEIDGKKIAPAKAPAFVSDDAAAFELAENFEASSDDSSAQLAFGFPRKLSASDASEAIVALAAPDSTIPEAAAAALVAPSGYVIRYDEAVDGQAGYAAVALVKTFETIPRDDGGDVPESVVTESEENPVAMPIATAPGGVTPHVYAEYIAEHADDVVYASQLHAQAAGTDLNAAWAAASGGLASSFTISDGGTYYLSDDLTTGSNLVIDAAGKNVTLRLDGHTLTINGDGSAAQKTMVSIVAAKSVTFNGSSEEGKSAIKSAGNLDVWGISSSAEGCAVSANELVITLASASNAQRNLGTHAVRMDSGTLSLTGCTVNMLMGNQSLSSSSMAQNPPEPPSAVFASSAVNSVLLTDCVVTAEGTQGFSCALNDTTSLGNAYAVYSQAGATTVAGGSYRAVSALGNATCLHATKLAVEPGASGSAPKLEADAGQLASGILSTQTAGVTLNAPVSFAVGAGFADCALAEAALRSAVEGGFVFGDCAPTGSATYSVLVMTSQDSIESANAPGSVIGAFGGSLSASQMPAIVGKLANALGSGCSVTQDLLGRVCFTFDNSASTGAVASIARSGSTAYYPTLASALAAFGDGDTLTFLSDADALEVAATGNATIDLNGHVLGALEFSSQQPGEGLVVKNGSVTGTQLVNGSLVSVYHHATAPLVLDGVDITAGGSDAAVYGVYGAASAGELTLEGGSTVKVTATRTSGGASAYGIGMPSGGPALVLDGAAIAASSASAGAAVYGISCANGLSMTGGSVLARGATGTTGAIYGGGDLSVKGAVLDVYTTGVSAASYGFGIWGRVSVPVATSVAVDSSTIKVSSAADLTGYMYACLLGATSDSSTSKTEWKLSGVNALASDSGLHMGLGLGCITLGNDFSLGSGSDSTLVVAQSQLTDDVAFVVEGSPSSSKLETLAALFEPRANSYYGGWVLEPDNASSRLVYTVDGAPTAGAVSLVRSGSVQAGYSTFSAALAQVQSGDTLRLNCDISESGIQSISQDDLVIDLNGHTFIERAGGISAASSSGYSGLSYSGTGKLSITGGSLDIRLGIDSEVAKASTVPYQGIDITGGGTLAVTSDAVVNVSYVGSTSAVASQRSVMLRGITVTDGVLVLDGTLNVKGASSDGAIGSVATYGILAQAAQGGSADVSVSRNARVSVEASSAAVTVKNAYYAEETYGATTNDGPTGLREISINPETDSAFYQDVLQLFRENASYDDPNDTSNRNGLKLGVYYMNNVALNREGAWYDGLRIWAYSDYVPTTKVGSFSAMTPDHVFVSSYYETLPQVYGVASDASSAGSATVSVAGSVSASCTHGNAFALDAAGDSAWMCNGASLAAAADEAIHPLSQGALDLRDYIKFPLEQAQPLVYSGTAAAKLVRFEPAKARCVVIADGAAFTFKGSVAFADSALDAAEVEADSFIVESSFALAGSSCTVANGSGANTPGATFAKGATSAQAALFADAYLALKPELAAAGAAWSADVSSVVSFQVGDAVVARYANPSSIDLSEPTAKAKRGDDQRQSYELVGWSLDPDENASSGYEPSTSTVQPQAGAVYYAVYETGLVDVPVTFTNVFSSSGSLQRDVAFSARYGATVAEALADAGVAMPAPSDYTDSATGQVWRFAGWFPYSASVTAGALLYDADKLGDLAVTLEVSGVGTSGLVLRAVYVACEPDQHLVTFKVDGYSSYCVVDHGQRPVFFTANGTNTSYVTPAKQVAETGKTFTFSCWYSDADGNGQRGDAEGAYPSVLPKATADATYLADFTWEWSDVTLTFYVEYYDEAADKLVMNGVRVIDTTYEQETQDVADSIAKVGSTFGYGGKVYTLNGWGVRRSDAEAVYDASHRLPSVTSDRTMSTSYAKTFYGVYSVADHVIDVTFFDGDGATELGSAQKLVAINTSVDGAFAATGSAIPEASGSLSFLGWATRPSASTAINGTATMLENLVTYSDTSLSLYAVYGDNPSCTVRLRDEANDTIYRISVAYGSTVAAALKKADTSITMSAPTGRYFAGWYTAAGRFFGFDDPVTGNADLYAAYKNIKVDTSSAPGVKAKVALSNDLNSTLGIEEELGSIRLSVVSRTSPDTILASDIATAGYSVVGSYTVKLVATYASGEKAVLDGEIGTMQLSLPVDAKLAHSKLHVFWLGLEKGRETILRSNEKELSDKGLVTVNIGNTEVGDESEGGNVSVVYVEGGTGTGAISGSGTSGMTGAGMSPGSGLSSSDLSSGLSSSGLSSSGLSSSLANSASGASASADGNAVLAAQDGASDEEAADDAVASGESEESPLGGWDADAVVLVALVAAALAALVYGFWRLAVVRPRREEAEAEMPSMQEQYAGGLRF